MRQAKVKAFAKVNLCLEVLGRRPDGYHDLRTIFQTISLADTLEVEFRPGRGTAVALSSSLEIPDNLALRAAQAVMEATNARGSVGLRLTKRIPMGGGLGGGSTDAAAVLLTLPVLTGRTLSWEQMLDIGTALGSDVPYFLMGGTALGLGRGTELYPIPITKRTQAVLVAPGIHVSTPEAFAALGRTLTWEGPSPKINTSQRVALALGDWTDFCSNDFEPVVFRKYPQIGAIKGKLQRLGARPALMTGSGSAVFGVFSGRQELTRAKAAFRHEQVFTISFLSRARYFAFWRKQLSEHTHGKQWPPQSRYSR